MKVFQLGAAKTQNRDFAMILVIKLVLQAVHITFKTDIFFTSIILISDMYNFKLINVIAKFNLIFIEKYQKYSVIYSKR